ncbi:hypothetical protein F5Y12DRAFT_790904 [Xylaria sp. FL1777]|nr:hypothetical protein F5Y12DRAFT_790904 [Xylaria sp. FL1777]
MSIDNRRNTRASGQLGSIEDIIKDAKTVAEHKKRVAEHTKRALREQKYEQKYQSEGSPQFHGFMRLPKELRADIYFLVMEDADSPRRYLHILRAPTLALVSKQIREEAVAVFLSRCTFYCKVESNWMYLAAIERTSNGMVWLPQTCCIEAAARRSGQCQPMTKWTRSWLLKMQGDGEELLFPNVELQISHSLYCRRIGAGYLSPRRHYRDEHDSSVLTLRARSGRLLLDYTDPKDITDLSYLQRFRMDAVTVARNIAAQQERHTGFSYEQLDEIVKSFRR